MLNSLILVAIGYGIGWYSMDVVQAVRAGVSWPAALRRK